MYYCWVTKMANAVVLWVLVYFCVTSVEYEGIVEVMVLCLFLLDLSTAFDTIDHDNLFCILEKYIGICGNALKLIKSYFSNRTQRVEIDNVLSGFANIMCGVPQGTILGPLKFCLYLLPIQ